VDLVDDQVVAGLDILSEAMIDPPHGEPGQGEQPDDLR